MTARQQHVALLTFGVLLAAGGACGPRAPEWHDGPGYRWAELPVHGRGEGFEVLAPAATGISFANEVTEEQALANEHLFNGSGVAAGDVDGDGRVDLYFARINGPNVLYRNLGGWRFEDVTARARVAAADRFSTGAVFADVDGDGDLDLLVTSLGGPHSLFINDGAGVFTDRTPASGLAPGFYGTTMALADVDADGDLDLYVANNKVRSVRDLYPPWALAFDSVLDPTAREPTLKPEFRAHYQLARVGDRLSRFEIAEPDKFYLNDGTGRFVEVPFTAGAFLDEQGRPLEAPPVDWGLTARFYDVDQDGDPDLYVCNDFESPDRFWINDGRGRFRLIAREAVRTTSNANMAVDFADVDRDGDVDIVQVDMLDPNTGKQKTQRPTAVPAEEPALGVIGTPQQVPRNVLLMNRGDGTFAEIGLLAGLEASGWSWGTAFLDVDLDGYEDVVIANGHAHDFLDMDTRIRPQRFRTEEWRHMRFMFPPLPLHNMVFRNRGDRTFEAVPDGWGFGREADVSHGLALADLDGDGDLDVITNRLGQAAGVYRNRSGRPRVAVRLVGMAPNTRGVGAKVRLEGGAVPLQQREVTAGGMYLSGSDPLVVFAAGEAVAMTLTVEWPRGGRSVIEHVRPNRMYEIHEARAQPANGRAASGSDPPAWFEDATAGLGHRHVETEYNDFVRQPLVPYRLSQGGPGIAWHDLDGDGDEDLVIGAGRGGRLGIYRNDRGRLTPLGRVAPVAEHDHTSIVGITDERGAKLLVGQSNYEAATPESARTMAGVLRVRVGLGDGSGVELRPAGPSGRSTAGPMALADVDADGWLDLFVGGRVLPARYPEPAQSEVWRGGAGGFVFDSAASAPLAGVGLVSAALFSDLDLDGDPDLVLALEWDAVRVFINEGGRFTDRTRAWGMLGHRSLWHGVASGDLNGDGLPDLVATSWGRNVRWRVSDDRPLEVHYADFDANGVLDVVLAQFDPRLGDVVPLDGWDRLSAGLPYLRRRFESYSGYADATVRDAIGPPLSNATRLDVTTLEHAVFLNRGGRFERSPLPLEAQLAPAFGVVIADFDGDGHEDVFLAQNFFATEPETQRYDAGRSLLLLGDGTGRLQPVPGAVSGITVYGDARGVAVADFDGDGRLDAAVGQNGNATRLFRNRHGPPGLRVQLRGPAHNPAAIGAAVRVVYGDHMGPVREIQAGSGYWSHNGATQILGLRGEPTAVWVRWPGGAESRTPLAAGQRDVAIAMDRVIGNRGDR